MMKEEQYTAETKRRQELGYRGHKRGKETQACPVDDRQSTILNIFCIYCIVLFSSKSLEAFFCCYC